VIEGARQLYAQSRLNAQEEERRRQIAEVLFESLLNSGRALPAASWLLDRRLLYLFVPARAC